MRTNRLSAGHVLLLNTVNNISRVVSREWCVIKRGDARVFECARESVYTPSTRTTQHFTCAVTCESRFGSAAVQGRGPRARIKAQTAHTGSSNKESIKQQS